MQSNSNCERLNELTFFTNKTKIRQNSGESFDHKSRLRKSPRLAKRLPKIFVPSVLRSEK